MSGILHDIFTNPIFLLTFVVLIAGILMIASPYFPGSSVTENNNNNAYLALIIVGTFLILFGVWLSWKSAYSNIESFRNFIDNIELWFKGVQVLY